MMKRYCFVLLPMLFSLKVLQAQHNGTAEKPPVVILCFDDAEESHISNVAPLLKKYDFPATFLVCEMPHKSPGDSVYYMTWPQITELHKMGFEIGNHTGHHKNMTKLSVEEKKQEISYIDEKCGRYGIPKPVSFAYPGNRDDSLSQIVLKELGYKFARTGGSQYFDASKDSLLAIPGFTMGSSEKLASRTMKALEDLQPGQVLAFTFTEFPILHTPITARRLKCLHRFLNT